MNFSFEHADKIKRRKNKILVGFVIDFIAVLFEVLLLILAGFRNNTLVEEKKRWVDSTAFNKSLENLLHSGNFERPSLSIWRDL